MLGHHFPTADKSQQLLSYVEDYLECVETLPLDIQRNVSLLREIDAKYQGTVFSLSLTRASIYGARRARAEMVEQARAVGSHFAELRSVGSSCSRCELRCLCVREPCCS